MNRTNLDNILVIMKLFYKGGHYKSEWDTMYVLICKLDTPLLTGTLLCRVEQVLWFLKCRAGG